MSLTPGGFFAGRRSNFHDPFAPSFAGPFSTPNFPADPFAPHFWAPFQGFPFGAPHHHHDYDYPDEAALFANTEFDWEETPEALVFTARVPGLRKEEVRVRVLEEGGRVLEIAGERRRDVEEKRETWKRVERRGVRFVRRFGLPESAMADMVRHSVENGVLVVTVPKKGGKKSTHEVVNSSSSSSTVTISEKNIEVV